MPREYLENFPYDIYFFQETPFTALALTSRFIKRLLNKYCNLQLAINQKPSITASEFADILVDIWTNYQKQNNP